MPRGFPQQLAELVVEHWAVRLLSAVSGVLTVGGTLVLGLNTGWLQTAWVAALLLAFGLFCVMSVSCGILVHRYREAQRLVDRYTGLLDETVGREYRVRAWRSRVDVAANGDVDETIDVTLQVLARNLRVLRFENGSSRGQSDRQRRQFTVEVGFVESTNGRLGARMDTTTLWRPDGVTEVLAFCHVPAVRDSILSVRLTYHWPRKLVPLVRGERDYIWFPFRKGVEVFSYTIVLPDDREVFAEHVDRTGRCTLTTTLDQIERRTRVELAATNVPPRAEFGLWLQAGES